QTIGDYEGLVIRSGTKVTADVIAKAVSLRVVGRAGIGVDNVDLHAASKRGIVVMNTPTGNAVTTAEHALSLLMSLARRIPQASGLTHLGKWEKNRFKGRELEHKTLGIVGLGTIGKIVADRARGLRMQVIACDPAIQTDVARELSIELVTMEQLLRRSDFITIHAPLVEETRNLFDDAAFEKVKKDLLLVNAARGGIVDEYALARALDSKKLAGAALDVFETEPLPHENPLLGRPDVVLTPHLGASTVEAQERVAVEIGHQVADYLLEGTIRNGVNAHSIDRNTSEKLMPYLRACRTLGLLVGQLDLEETNEIRVMCTGEAAQLGIKPITNAVVAGYLEVRSKDAVNPISAPFEAKDRGIAVVEIEEKAQRYATAVRTSLTSKAGIHTATVTLGTRGETRLVGLEGYEVDTVLEGTMLIMRNRDRPGVVGAVGSLLGAQSINVSRVQVSLNEAQEEALAIWNLDASVPEGILSELRSLENVRAVVSVSL
ncbi:MAG: phosphoglycerate dehydrogenase, partial [Myxococcota bacterium]